MANSKKRCLDCRQYQSVSSGIVCNIGFFCGNDCRVRYGINKTKQLVAKSKQVKQKRYAVRKREFYENDIKTRKESAQKAFNAFIRERDREEPCISCQKHHAGQYHCGHYRTRGAASQLAFNEDNAHKQCSVCNNYLSGNLAEYRLNLIDKIGLERVEALEGNNEPLKRTASDYKEIEICYKQKLKELLQ